MAAGTQQQTSAPRPTALKVVSAGIPDELKKARRLVLWRYEYRDDWTKSTATAQAQATATAYFADILATYARDGMEVAFWGSASNGKPANGGTGPVRKIGMVEEIPGPLQICTPNALHGSLDPTICKGSRLWIVGLYLPVQRDGNKIASLKREIIAEIPNFLE